MHPQNRRDHPELTERCLAAFIAAGTLDLSLDQLSARVGLSKRMLIHYFGGREDLEYGAIALLEDRLREGFGPASLPAALSPKAFVLAMWERSTNPASHGVLRLIMDVTQRGWNGSERAREFYAEQQRMWTDLLRSHFPDARDAEELLLLFQGAILVFLVTGDAERGRRVMTRRLKQMNAQRPK